MIVVCFGGINPANIPHNGCPAFAERQSKTVDPSPCYHPGERLEALSKVPGSHPV
jgi:hypothetical protein